MPAALIWLLLGLALLLLELLGAEFEGLLAAAVAALVLSVASGLLPLLPPAVQVTAFLVCTGLLIAALQRWSRRRARGIPPTSGDERATVISGFPAGGDGRVLWQGQSWAAVNLDGDRALTPGMAVTVLGREGTRLQVLPPAATPLE